MDGVWRFELKATLQPESHPHHVRFLKLFPKYAEPDLKARSMFITNVKLLSQRMKMTPYNPHLWLERGGNLLHLGFPDLAVSDVYKAMLLLEHVHDSSPSPQAADNGNERNRQILSYAIIVMSQALFLSNSFAECYQFIQKERLRCHQTAALDRLAKIAISALEAERRFCNLISVENVICNDMFTNKASVRSSSAQDLKPRSGRNKPKPRSTECNDSEVARKEREQSGSVLSQIYPWTPASMAGRRKGLLENAGKVVANASSGKCSLHTILKEKSTIEIAKSTVLGLFADVNLADQEVVMEVKSVITGVNDEQGRCSACRATISSMDLGSKARFCGDLCRRLAGETYLDGIHDLEPQCFRYSDFNKTCQLLGSAVSRDRRAYVGLLRRIFQSLLKHKPKHPLQIDSIYCLTAGADLSMAHLFSFAADVALPISLLIELGVDIFADTHFDMWVLQSIQARIRTNCRTWTTGSSDEYCHLVVDPALCFVNHSCKPNAVVVHKNDNGCSAVEIQALEPIEVDEEICISYIPAKQLGLGYHKRQELSKTWTGGICQCDRCREERLAMSREHTQKRENDARRA